jgi:AmiR/NasT family two-component response regulator
MRREGSAGEDRAAVAARTPGHPAHSQNGVIKQEAPEEAQLERDVADVVGANHARQASVWVAIGMLKAQYGLDERASLAYLSRRATQRELPLHELAASLMARQERP